ncbi:AAA family ATPase [Pseudonocardia sp. MH-G8]|uniref:ATP-binding protein n=1 Tax=Pseudonocardia sp. MH-G8 TaxID=1854588 RepID=UPI000BA1730F|nr:AAA family ATPase [Pseudonocardia sp. MH-G8]OZM78379.1 transcriptional regulator [Pseudonocardia sp. MH-G8]
MPAPNATRATRRRTPSGVSHARLVLRCLGEASATLDGRTVPELTAPRMQRLIARVALARDAGVPRDRLAGELWPDSTAAQARTNLRKLLHDLRRALPAPGAVVDADARTVRWCADRSAWLDVLAFDAAATGGDPAAAVRCYGGDLLPACDDEWVVAERERLRLLAVDACAGLAVHADAEHRDADVVTYSRLLLGIDALHEPTCRLLMRTLARRGERSEALRVYQRLAETLAGELGVAPEPATAAVAARLRATAPTAPAGPDLVGRAAEWRAVRDTWGVAAAGSARLLLVTGEAGIGKSRLVEELARRAAAEGHAVAGGRAYEAGGRPPWGPVVDWLRSEPVRAGLDALGDVWLAELARLLPELRPAHPQLPDGPPATDVGRRHHLLDAVRRGLLATGRPLLLVVDDLQWCDADTIDLCGYLVRCAPSAPLLVAGTARDDDDAGAHAVARLRRHLAPAGAVTTIPLGPLGAVAVAEMATQAGRRLRPDAVARLWRETEGNPLFVLEAVRAGFGTGPAARVALTPTVHAVITARLDRLSPGARALAEIAATIGREFTTAVLATAAGRSEDELTGDLDELWQHHVIRERGQAFDFSHDRLREVALQLISPARRRRLHRRVAEAVELHHAADLDPVSARLAIHWTCAGLASRAVTAYEQAARHAHRVFALDDCIDLLERALRLLDESARGAGRDEVELRLRSALGVPLVARRGYGAPEALRCYERALTLHRKLGRRPGPAVLRGLALHAVATLSFDRAQEKGRELLAADATDSTARTEGEYVLGVTAFWRGEFAAAEHHLRAAIGSYRIEDAPLHVARYAQDPLGVCSSRLALTQLFRGRPADAAASMQEALRVAAELDDPMTTGYVRAFDAILVALEPRGRDLRAAVDALDTATHAMHIGYFAIVAQFLRGWCDVLDGDLGGVDVIRRATDRLRQDQPLHLTLGLSLLARAHLRAGDPRAGSAVVAEAVARTTASGQRYLLAELLRIDAELRAATGDRAGARRSARGAIDEAVAADAPWLRDRAAATARLVGDG